MAGKIELINRRNKKQIAKMIEDGWFVLDVSNRSEHPTWQKFSPRYPHGDIPVPGRDGTTAVTVEGIWQGLKTFKEGSGIDTSKFNSKTSGGVARSKRKYGEIAGFLVADALIDEANARLNVFLPAYKWVLEHKLGVEMQAILDQLRLGKNILLIDHNVGEDINDVTKRFSHAAIIKSCLMDII